MAAPERDGYQELRDVRVELNTAMVRGGGEGCHGEGGFALYFWLYLSSSARPSSVILHQITTGSTHRLPFLALGEGNKLLLFPLSSLHREAPNPASSYPWTDTRNLSAINKCPLEKWFHVGCEVTKNVMRLHIDGNLIAEARSFSPSGEADHPDEENQISFVGSGDKLEGYAYNIEISFVLGSIQQSYEKDPPFKLIIDFSCCDGIEEGDDGIWSIVGGKASCRRNFILEVVLVDAFGEPVKDKEVVASLVYADNGTVVEKSRDDSEPPLLITYEGLEYPAISKPLPIIRGRALFKLKISQLSSKCDNKLFRIHFSVLHMQRYTFMEAYSKPIRCISRNRTSRPLGSGKQSSVVCFHLSELSKTEGDGMTKAAEIHRMTSQSKHSRKVSVSKETHNVMGTDSSTSDYDSFDAGSSWSGSDGDEVETFSDAVIFRYCLDSTYERSKFLRGAALTVNKDDLVKLADQVSMYSGCPHHRNQILISKRLLQECGDTWNIISKNNDRALWSSAIPDIAKKFMEISHSVNRGLSEQDLEVLRGIAGCGDDIGRDEFDRLWHWLYPVATSLSKDTINKLWSCTAPTWIEGFITIEEAESALRSSRELLKQPGTFVLRFPTTRRWPHPDAGSLVVTYVGSDNSIHHRLLSLDGSDAMHGSLQDLLLQEPELSQLSRVHRLPIVMRR